MSEVPEESIKLNPETRKVKVLLDTSPQIAAKDEKIALLNKKIGEQESVIKSMLIRDKAEFTPSEHKKAPEGGDTADYRQNEHGYKQVNSYPLDMNSDIPLEFIKGKTPEDAITLTQELAKLGNPTCRKVIDKLTKKVIKNGVNFEYRGSSKDFLRSPLLITDNLPVEEQQRRKKINDRLRANRTQWVNLDSED